MPVIYKASTECRGVYVYEHIGLLLFFPIIPSVSSKVETYPHFAVEDPECREVK